MYGQRFNSGLATSHFLDGAKGAAIINSTAPAGYNMLCCMKSNNGVYNLGSYGTGFVLCYTSGSSINEGKNEVKYMTVLLNKKGDAGFLRNVTANSYYLGDGKLRISFQSRGNGQYDLLLQPGNSGEVSANCVLLDYSAFRPIAGNNIGLGTPSYRWKQVYAVNSAILTSDRN